MNIKTFKYRLYPTRSQERKLQATLDVCRGLYNCFLHDRKFRYEIDGKAPTQCEQEKKIAQWKAAHPELSTVHAHLLQNVAVRIQRAYESYFRRLQDYQVRKQAGRLKKDEKCPQPPRKKGRGVYDSLTWKEYGNGNKILPAERKDLECAQCDLVEQNSVCLSKIGTLKAIIHRPLCGTPKTMSVKRQGGKWFVTVSCEVEEEPLHDFHHQEARKIVNRFGLIAVEALDVSNMSASPAPKQDPETGQFLPNGHAAKAGLNKSILDAGWYSFRQIVSSKAASAGRIYVEVDPAFTSQDCSGCGYRAKKQLWERWHACPVCGLSLDRDTNSGNNVLEKGRGATRLG